MLSKYIYVRLLAFPVYFFTPYIKLYIIVGVFCNAFASTVYLFDAFFFTATWLYISLHSDYYASIAYLILIWNAVLTVPLIF